MLSADNLAIHVTVARRQSCRFTTSEIAQCFTTVIICKCNDDEVGE